MKILLVQLASNGDCLFVTAIARQIKEVNYPGSHLTWLISSPYKNVITNNSYIDEIIEIPIKDFNEVKPHRDLIKEHIASLKQNAHFDKIFITDYTSENQKNWFGTTRSSLFRSYPHKLKVHIEPLVFLTSEETDHVKKFAEEHFLTGNKCNILFECSPQSTQSNMTFERAYKIAEEIIRKFPWVKVILSSKEPFISSHLNIIDGSKIAWKENAELTKYCHLFVGCSSGISWLNTSNWAAQLPMVQNINPQYCDGKIVASVKVDFEYFGLNTKKLIEIGNADNDEMINCITDILERGFSHARKKYYIRDRVYYGGTAFFKDVLKNGSYRKGNLSNLQLLLYLFRSEVHATLSNSNFARKIYFFPKKIAALVKGVK